jgi:energy-coupling factor transporter ATP-binding protein EcfA2
MTDELLSPQRPADLLSELRRLIDDRVQAEQDVPERLRSTTARLESDHRVAIETAEKSYQADKAATEQEYASVSRAIEAQYACEHAAVHKEYRNVCAEIVARFEDAERSQKDSLRESQWEATTVFEAAKNGCVLQEKEVQQRLADTWREVDAIHEAATRLARQRGHWVEPTATQTSPAVANHDSLRRLGELLAQAKSQWLALQTQPLPRVNAAVRLLGGLASIALLTGTIAATVLQVLGWPTIVAASGFALAVVLLSVWIGRAARRQTQRGYQVLRQTWADVDSMRRHLLMALEAQARQQREALTDRLNGELRKADDAFAGVLSDLSLTMQRDLQQANGKYPAMLEEVGARRDRQLDEADKTYRGRLNELESTHLADQARRASDFDRAMADAQAQYDREWAALSSRWCGGVQGIGDELQSMLTACDRLFPPLDELSRNGWQPPARVPTAIRIGGYQIGLARLEGGLPRDQRLSVPTVEFAVPALLPFPRRSTLVVETGDDNMAATEVIQAIMLRMLTAMPPGKVRLTIIDPVGLGEPYSAFMHLADFDDKLVTNRIWTEAAHIEQRLADLTEHMENVIQLYLRNEYHTIEEYNRTAGEMAEPYRLLVVANFPVNVTEAAARRLTSIITSGARCGVFTLMSFNGKLRMPRDFHRNDIDPHAMVLERRDGQFAWTHAEVGPMALQCERLPDAKIVSELIRDVGRRAKDAARVEVPFAAIAPAELWTGDAREEIDIPLGRAGARKLQHLRLGRGTAQHVLLSGKTGSGKSTLLHVLVTNLALRYSPDEVELYLVDFKKGVEFKAYASAELPHARVIAIESEREFGLSVLQRLDGELKQRGDLFRKHEVQDLKGFRAALPGVRLPRVLLVVDEFQELFVEDDRIAQEGALLLDRLVRQGRAFGIHVLLGSQTLAGAYSLPRSTIGQMAVRIALQCSESDAHLILSEDNTAARLLSRPGEAIYNDANGLFEGNHPFQVVWLSDAQRDQQLKLIRAQAAGRPPLPASVVFEGNASADVRKNAALGALLSAPAEERETGEPSIWLGSPVAIKDATRATLVRQGGSNLLVVGHREEMALGMFASAIIALAAQHAPGKARFTILGGAAGDDGSGETWLRLKSLVPHEVVLASAREAADPLAALAAEVDRRSAAGDETAAPWYLIVWNLARFRDLRKSDDDFGFGRHDEATPPSPSRQFGAILQEGPGVGVHSLVWCDSYQTTQRFFDRRAMGQFELRVAFHMNASDSSSLIESPIAGQLGVHRAILYHAAEAWQEKFCPYGPPPAEWLDWVQTQFAARPT